MIKYEEVEDDFQIIITILNFFKYLELNIYPKNLIVFI